MKKINITMIIVVISIVGAIINSGSLVILNIQATSETDNNTQPSNQGTIQLELTPPETIVQSENLQNPSIQESLQQQQQQQQQQPLNLSSANSQQPNPSNIESQVSQNNLAPNTGDVFNLCNPSAGTCK